ncbi:cytochrome P450 [Streptomyces sp. NPDC059247]|uniref:cytochrome P450 n=1 Tax=Streptomyces sp. NPDC059247 TaxID=3346790 RepID=UPI0036B6761D
MTETPFLPGSTAPTLRGWPLAGHAVPLIRDPLGFITSLRDRGDLVAFRLGPLTMYAVNSPELLHELLVVKASSFDKGRQFDKLRPWWGDGLATNSDHASHRRQRRLMQPAFHRRQITAYIDEMREVTEEQIDAWPTGRTLALDEELYGLTLAVTLRNLFSTGLDDNALTRLSTSLQTVLDGVLWRCLDTTDLVEKLPLPTNRRFSAAVESMHATVDEVIDRHRADGGDLLSMLKQARDPDTGEAMSRRQIHDEVITLLITGSETTRATLGWACLELSRNPGIQRRMQEEVDTVLAGEPVRADHLEQLPYTRAVVAETLRAHPVVWLLTRRAVTDVTLGPYRIPAGAAVCYSPYALHHDPAHYPDPDRFDPGRFTGGAAEAAPACPADGNPTARERSRRPRDTNLAFGAGTRACIGEPLAWAHTIVILATLAQRRTLTLAPGTRVRPAARMLLTPDCLPITARPRHVDR